MFFEKFVVKWLSLEASNHCKGSDIQKSQKKVPDFGFNHLFSRIGPFWVIWSNKNFFDFWIIQKFQSLTAPQNILKKIAKCPKNHIFSKTEPHGENSHILTEFFQVLKFSEVVPNLPIYHSWRFGQNRLHSFWKMVQKPPKNTVFGHFGSFKIFFSKKGLCQSVSLINT